jgi:adenine-specific DNA-methyltransferase
MAHEKLRPEYLFDEEKIAQLKQMAPECFEDGKINFETLRQNLGDWPQDEEDPELEHFGLFWPGKRDARRAAAISPEGTLEPVWGDGLKADGTSDTDGVNDSKNIFIEGENLEVLKLLQKSYAGKIKMIYIDPPYNTGNDFVYDDDFTEPLQEYLRRTGQVDEEGRAMTTNKRSDGRFHSKWLSMMYPRLRLARNLLRDDGVIFVSIDDNEVHNLKALLNEVFGEENNLATLVWDTNHSAQAGVFKVYHQYILVFCKEAFYINTPSSLNNELFEAGAMKKASKRHVTSSFIFPKGTRINAPDDKEFFGQWGGAERVKLISGRMIVKNNQLLEDVELEAAWTQANQMKEYFNGDKNNIIDSRGQKVVEFYFTGTGKLKIVKERGVSTPPTVQRFGTQSAASVQLSELFNFEESPFDSPKPVSMVKEFCGWFINDGDIVLDFFAGSGTTAHSVLEFVNDNDLNVNFITIQLPVDIKETDFAYSKGYRKVTDITIDRIKLANKKYNSSAGFKNYKLNFSSFKKWKNYKGISIAELELTFDEFNQSPLREGYTEDGLLTEIMLLEGFTLCSTITPLAELTGNKIRKVTSEYCDHALLVCLDKEIQKQTIQSLQLGENDIFVCLDSSISTEDKLRLSDKGLIKTI